jgi:hypothetical protein
MREGLFCHCMCSNQTIGSQLPRARPILQEPLVLFILVPLQRECRSIMRQLVACDVRGEQFARPTRSHHAIARERADDVCASNRQRPDERAILASTRIIAPVHRRPERTVEIGLECGLRPARVCPSANTRRTPALVCLINLGFPRLAVCLVEYLRAFQRLANVFAAKAAHARLATHDALVFGHLPPE